MYKIICICNNETKELTQPNSDEIKVFHDRKQAEILAKKLNSNTTEAFTWHVIEA